jgi:CubicO group peptidase (beta-lactamase class C family)
MTELGEALARELEPAMERLGVPGVAIGVLERGRELRLSRGVTNVLHPLPVDDGALFQVASNSKPFTATLVMRLVEERRVELDAPVQRYLPEFQLPQAEWSERVTVRHLLTHRVGWDGDALFVHRPARSCSRPTRCRACWSTSRPRAIPRPGCASAAASIRGCPEF